MVASKRAFLYLWSKFGLWLHEKAEKYGSWNSTSWEPTALVQTCFHHVVLATIFYPANCFFVEALKTENKRVRNKPDLCRKGFKVIAAALIRLARPCKNAQRTMFRRRQENSSKPYRGSIRVKLNPAPPLNVNEWLRLVFQPPLTGLHLLGSRLS